MTCKHEHIQTWRFEDGEPAMWSCVDCAAKFEPIKGWMDQIERKDALLRQALETLENDVQLHCYLPSRQHHLQTIAAITRVLSQ